jgi:hypothetical protein
MSLAEPKQGSGLKDPVMRNKGIKMADRAQRRMNKMAKVGRAERLCERLCRLTGRWMQIDACCVKRMVTVCCEASA